MKYTILASAALLLLPFGAFAADSALVRGTSSSAVYYRADGGRYAFPDEKTYFTWFTDFSAVTMVADAELSALPLKGSVRYRPGVRLVKITTDPKVYAVDAGNVLRWLSTEQLAIELYGADWNRMIVDVPDAFFAGYTMGAPITVAADHDPVARAAAAATINAALGLPADPAAPVATTRARSVLAAASDKDLLPDLMPFAPYDFRFGTINGRTVIKFTATLWNAGYGAMEINTDAASANAANEQKATQRIFQKGGGYRDVDVGLLEWHVPHAHYHYGNFGEYKIAPVQLNSGVAPSIAQKVSFCLRDDIVVRTPGLAPREPKKYNGCLGFKQGVSVGWADIYPHTLPDQYFDINGFPSGTYRVSFTIDPLDTFHEVRRDNNQAAALLELDMAKRTIKVIGELSPFQSSSNTMPDGTFINVEGSDRIYVMFGGRKRLLRLTHVGDTYSWPPTAVEAIPNLRFVKAEGGTDIYMINEAGWKRRMLNVTALNSYGADSGIVASISAAELNAYKLTDLVSHGGKVYAISTRTQVGALGSLSADLDATSIQAVSDADFAAYGFK